MSLTFSVHVPLELLSLRKVRFAVELLDAVSLARVSEGVAVSAAGIVGGPVVNASGLFVWLTSHVGDLKSLDVDPGDLPYEALSLQPSQLATPLTTIELSPTGNYP